MKSLVNEEITEENWLGKLLLNGNISRATIIHCDKTWEEPKQFREVIDKYKVQLIRVKEFLNNKNKINIDLVHICRSGAWTPPWLDDEFFKFVEDSQLGMVYENIVDRWEYQQRWKCQ